ncbi:hypothetical protein PNI0360_00894 [Streptococcus pneumoniae PNI0360]|nr:hypothetical protein PNI0002_00338 [Streptococcus pneumoniae PNI0002]ELU88837.1 hypothetical protein PNI0360_00894 [Streptococcus pneumoniae PNI0360]ELU90620.1 hypothetical protein PNI0446_02320 [Streptococcus pneumoniae PNI0446]
MISFFDTRNLLFVHLYYSTGFPRILQNFSFSDVTILAEILCFSFPIHDIIGV